MMNKLFFYIIISVFIGLISCSSVRTNTSTRKQPLPKSIANKMQNTKQQEPSKQAVKPKSRFTDTTKVVIKPNIRTTHVSINTQLDSAIFNFEKGSEEGDIEKRDKSCLEIRSFAETFAEGDSLKFEALFYKCECLIYKENYAEAEKELSDLINDKQIPNSVLERSLIRLGQVYCAMERSKEANAIFAKFNKIFPNSIYKEFANCESIRNSE
ncbi:MAG: hypothetical protein EPN82_10050 [Bacteroidetes bacterium]|nr:MAG: hypothetical protein EPN82_10050 [Bacteroidota bacterium]